MLVLSWILGIVGAAYAWLVLLASGMTTVPRLRFGSAVGAIGLPLIALLMAVLEDAWLPMLLPGATVAMVSLSYVQQPASNYLKRWIERRTGKRPRIQRPLRNAACVEAPPWTLRLRRIAFERLRLEIERDGRRTGRATLPDGAPSMDVTEDHVAIAGDVCAVAHGTVLRGFRASDGRLLWTLGLALGPISVHALADDATLVAVGPGGLRAHDLEGKPRWQESIDGAESVFVEDAHAVARFPDGSERRYALATGEPVRP